MEKSSAPAMAASSAQKTEELEQIDVKIKNGA